MSEYDTEYFSLSKCLQLALCLSSLSLSFTTKFSLVIGAVCKSVSVLTFLFFAYGLSMFVLHLSEQSRQFVMQFEIFKLRLSGRDE